MREMREERLLYVIGPARSGTTFVLAQLNASEEAFLFSELNSFEFESGGAGASDFQLFVEEFNRRKLAEGNQGQKGAWISANSSLRSPRELYSQLQQEYLIVGEKIALSGRWPDGRYPADVLFDVQINHHLHARHLLLLRHPTRILASQMEMFPRTPTETLFESLVRSFLRIVELSWRLPRVRLLFYEQIDSEVLSGVFGWLGLDWARTRHLPFAPRSRKDWSFTEVTLRSEVPQLAAFERIYEKLLECKITIPSGAWKPTRDFLSAPEFERIQSQLQGLLQESKAGKRRVAVPVPQSAKQTVKTRTALVLETDFPCAPQLQAHLRALPPGGTHETATYAGFMERLRAIYPDIPARLLDIGCGDGGFLRIARQFSFPAVGLDLDPSPEEISGRSSDSPQRFSCDYTKPFTLWEVHPKKRRRAKFHVITCWNLLEHVPKRWLNELLINLRRHLDDRLGLLLSSISLRPCFEADRECHAPVWPESRWREVFRDCGFFLLDRLSDYLGPFPTRYRSSGDTGELCLIAATSRANNEVTLRIDRLLEHFTTLAPPSWSELPAQLRSLEESLRRTQEVLECKEEEVNRLGDALRGFFRRREGLDLSELPEAFLIKALQVAEDCRQRGIHRVALFGAGGHSRALLLVWKHFPGPEVEVVLASHPQGATFETIPVLPVGTPLPREVEAIVPSSHSYEKEMQAIAQRTYPETPWLPFWER